ncbi:hypothetical protein BpHYR1_018933 [Brachionus plicatilis]|uniref:Uncharacterized protein n=1 Tax=Brachionus plicatilis TaxID=10195 RepID=A0A3M7S724_BRAPC|nr:hypothetical protein BpHYR1_018933 [Brachionus plicatilis]
MVKNLITFFPLSMQKKYLINEIYVTSNSDFDFKSTYLSCFRVLFTLSRINSSALTFVFLCNFTLSSKNPKHVLNLKFFVLVLSYEGAAGLTIIQYRILAERELVLQLTLFGYP